jgi:DNA-binding beta-propeller fold protein YncE
VTSARKNTLVRVLAVVLASAAGRASAVGFTPAASIYGDAKGDSKEVALKRPEGVACADGGAIVIADTGNGRLVTYAAKAGVVIPGTEVKLTQLTFPTRLQLDSKGNVLALDGRSRRIVRLDEKRAFRGYVETKGVTGAVIPAAFKVDASDNVYVLDVAGRRVLVADPAGNVARTLPLPKGVFTDLAVDPTGTVFTVDAVTAMVFAADKGSAELKAISRNLKEYMSFPAYMTASKGKLYLVDQNGMGIVVLGQDGSYQGRQLSLGSNEGYVHYPAQLCINGNAEAFIADRLNNRVQIFKVVE